LYLEGRKLGPMPEMPFSTDGVSRGQVFSTAWKLRESLWPDDDEKWFCLATDDRCVAAAALLAAASVKGGIVFPHSLSDKEINATAESGLVAGIITDQTRTLEAGGFTIHRCIVSEGSAAHPPACTDPDLPFVQLHTGGTTGKSRQWTKNPGNLFGEGRTLIDIYDLKESDTLVSTVPLYHIYGLLLSVVVPLVSGSRIVRESLYFPATILAELNLHKSSVLISSPVHLAALTMTSGLTGIRMAFSSAGLLPSKTSVEFSALFKAPVHEVYGSTETGGIATRTRARGEDLWTPLPGIELTPEDKSVAVRSPWVSGSLVGTPARLVLGDLVEFHDGRFKLIGRTDGVVKVGGRRVEIECVRERITELAGVRNVWVTTRPSVRGRGIELMSLVETSLTAEKLRLELGRCLETWEIPRRIVVVDKLPISEAGKIDREAALQLLTTEKR